MHKRILFALTIAVAGAAAAQNAPRDPADPRTPAKPVEYRSAFADYRPHGEIEIAPWREVNDEVGRVGGHLGIVRAQQKAGERVEAAKPEAKSSGHGMQHQ